MTIDLLTNPLNSGKAEIEAAPTMHNVVVILNRFNTRELTDRQYAFGSK